MFFDLDKIEIFAGLIKFSEIFFLVNIILLLHFFISWRYEYKKSGVIFDYWTFFCILYIVIPIFLLYPFASSDLNVISTRDEIKYIEQYVDQAYFISILGYFFMCVGKKMCGSQYSLRLNVLERLVYKNLKAPNFYKIICIFLIISYVFFIILNIKYPEYSLNLRLIRFDNPLIGSVINIITSLIYFFIIVCGLKCIEKKSTYRVVIFILASSLTIIIGVRSILILPIALLSIIYFILNREKIKKRNYMYTILLGIVLLLGTSLIRDASFNEFNLFESIILVLFQIFFGNTFSDLRDFSWVLTGFNDDFLLGKTYLSAIISFIPSSILEFRESYKYGIVTNNFAGIGNWSNHLGLRMTVFGEIYLNFGYIGIIIFSTIMGYILSYTNNSFIKAIDNKKDIFLGYVKTLVFWIIGQSFIFNSSSFFVIYVFLLINLIGYIIRKKFFIKWR